MYKITVPAAVWQWDINDTITVEGIEDISKWQVHFASTGDSNALVLEINPDMTCYIPNQLVELGQAIYAYLYNVEEQRAYTETAVLISVKARPRPPDYISTPTEALTWGQLRADIRTLTALMTDNKSSMSAAINDNYLDIQDIKTVIEEINELDSKQSDDIASLGEKDTVLSQRIDSNERAISANTDAINSTNTKFANYYTKAESYSRTEVDGALAAKQPTGNYATVEQLTEGLAEKQDVGDYVTGAGLTTKLEDYYAKTETYSQDEVNQLVSGMTHITVTIVPSVDEVVEPDIIYLVPVEGATDDSYDEYLLVNGSPERIGSTRVDLSQYYTKTETYSKSEVDTALNSKQPVGDYATTTALTQGLATKQPIGDYATNAALTAGLAKKQDVGNYVTSVNGVTPVNGNVNIGAVSVTAGDGISISGTGEISVTNPMDDGRVSTGTTWSSARVTEMLERAGTIKKYGILWDKVEAACTRLWDAVGITTDTSNFGHFSTVNPNYDNPFDSIYPWSERRVCNYDMRVLKTIVADGYDVLDAVTAWEGEETFSYDPAEGLGVGVYTPEFWYTAYDTAEGRVFGVSGAPIEGWYYSEPIIAGRWLGVVEQLDGVSVLGCRVGIPTSNVAIGTLHTYAENASMTIDDVYSWDAETVLQIVEYANMNTQIATGNGVSSLYRQNATDLIMEDATDSTVVKVVAANAAYAIPGAIMDIGTSNGGTQVGRRYVISTAADETDETLLCVTLDEPVTVTTANFWSIHGLINVADAEIGSASGYIGTNGRCNAYYRGRVTAGNKFQYCLGVHREGQTNKIWIVPTRYQAETVLSLDTSVCIDTGYTLPWAEGDAATSGYISKLILAEGIAAFPLCSALGGSSSKPVGDYTYIPAKGGNTVSVLGGYADYGSNAGRFSAGWHCSQGSSVWNLAASPSTKSSHRGS